MLDLRSALHQAAGKTILHTGDFYWLPAKAMHKALRGKQIDALYLDTTNLDLAQEPPSQVRYDAAGGWNVRSTSLDKPTCGGVQAFHLHEDITM